jgi:hypothetical protein
LDLAFDLALDLGFELLDFGGAAGGAWCIGEEAIWFICAIRA